jgi:hypothetical protein
MAEELPRDRFCLENLGATHAVGADLFVPFAITRLSGEAGSAEATLLVEERNA